MKALILAIGGLIVIGFIFKDDISREIGDFSDEVASTSTAGSGTNAVERIGGSTSRMFNSVGSALDR